MANTSIAVPKNRHNWSPSSEQFPIDVSSYRPLRLDLARECLTPEEQAQAKTNVALARESIVFFTAMAGAKGLGGHTGGPFDIAPEAILADGFRRGSAANYHHDLGENEVQRMFAGGENKVHHCIADAAAHRAAIHYFLAAANGFISWGDLLHYREAGMGLPGHPELDVTPGIYFSGGRLGHMWADVCGQAMACKDRNIIMLDSDGSQQEARNAGAARLAVEYGLNTKLFVDDNNTTISGSPKSYLRKFSLEKTLAGHGLDVRVCENPEDIGMLYSAMRGALLSPGPVAVLNKRRMAPGIAGIEGTPKGHDVINTAAAIAYLKEHGQEAAATMLSETKAPKSTYVFSGSSSDVGSNRDTFGHVVADMIDKIPQDQRRDRVLVGRLDLEGSCGFVHIIKRHPEVCLEGALISEEAVYAAAAGFGSAQGRQGIVGTFSAFQEMIISEVTMARLSNRNVLAHFSHAGFDGLPDNNCHAGINNFFAHNGLAEGDMTRLYMPADPLQMRAVVERVFDDPGLRFVYSTRSAVPYILREDGTKFFDPASGYRFVPGKDEVIRDGTDGYVVSYGEMLHRALDAVERLWADERINIGLVNKPTLNVPDHSMLERLNRFPFVFVVEGQNEETGLGARFGSWLARDAPAKSARPLYDYRGATKSGISGMGEQMAHQGLDSASIMQAIRDLYRRTA